ncbi:S8 family serine peptidase [Kribbella sp. NBC_01245]|uniref:S8 family peptidase n=1 Tax=Kribbella sp. NBC_01245 TaxID=2903578 RepID=UPI002E2CA627|nr:S8 family serine peptidase [Kribbella sp. NBC_01245]
MARRRWLIAQGTVLAVVVSGLAGATAATAQPTAEPTDKPAAGSKVVTLITGDKVHLAPKGKSWDVRVDPARRIGAQKNGHFQQVGPGGVTVIPAAAMPLVRAGVLDRALFDVTGLLRQGLDDAHTKEVPLLVQTSTAKAPALQLGRVVRQLPKAKLTAVAAPKTGASFEKLAIHAAGRTAGVTKIWLNGKARPSLDVSAKQVGAPTAWQAGLTGAGVKVAVLDGGYDPGHADLKGVVKGEKDFTGSSSGIKDTDGHGTHVASTVAGRGTASGGKYTGVAKGADLLVGRVCDGGWCSFDDIIAGMQWAADSGARVINMSLGGGASDGTDPISQEVNRLTAASGALFVIAAGNDGPNGQVSSPAAADAALAVASVTKQDELSEFSSVGPRVGDYAMKPDVAAPGSDIIAARAEGTLEDYAVDENYAKISGTSMATPHVAGAAAILAGQHPDWKAGQLKAALMASAHPIQATSFQQGAGRIDLARAIKQQVTAEPTGFSFGQYAWPHENAEPRTKEVTLHNSGTTAVTLNLSVEGPAGLFTTDVPTVTIPAGGQAPVRLTVDPAKTAVGTVGGRLVATGNDGVALQVPIGVDKEAESYDLTLKMIDRAGAELPANSENAIAFLVSLDDQAVAYDLFGSGKVRLPAGRYAVMSYVYTPIPGSQERSRTAIAEPELNLTANRTLTLDARLGVRSTVAVEADKAKREVGLSGMLVDNGKVTWGYISGFGDEHFAVPTKGDHPSFAYYTRVQIERRSVEAKVTAPETFDVPVSWVPDSKQFVDTLELDAIDAGRARPEDLEGKDLRGKLAVFTLSESDGDVFDQRVTNLAQAGAAATLFFFSEPIRLSVEGPEIPSVFTEGPEGVKLAGLKGAKVNLVGHPASPYRYELAIPELGGIPANLTYRPRNSDLAEHSTKYHALLDRGGSAYIDYGTTAGRFDLGSALWSNQIELPLARKNYYSPGVTWETSVRVAPPEGEEPAHEQGFRTAARVYRAGEKAQVDWNRAAFTPGVTNFAYADRERGPYLVYRDGDTIDAFLPLFSDSDRHAGPTRPEDYSYFDQGTTSLYADGKLVATSNVPGDGVFAVKPGAAKYRLSAEVKRVSPIWPLATRVQADWTFGSAHTRAAKPLPLLAVGFEPQVDLYNWAPGGKAIVVPVRVDRQPGTSGGAVDLKKVEASFDDGKTWKSVPIRKTGPYWQASFVHPKTGFVSLRATAADAGGNTVKQTTIRAYRLK